MVMLAVVDPDTSNGSWGEGVKSARLWSADGGQHFLAYFCRWGSMPSLGSATRLS